MADISNQVLHSAKEVNCEAREISLVERDKLIFLLKEKYSDKTDSPYFWETINNRFSIQNKESWAWVGEYSPNDKTFMLFLDNQNETGVVFEKGMCIPKVLWNCTGFEFYLTNHNVDYIIAFNHHDYLIASGMAEEWLKSKIKQ